MYYVVSKEANSDNKRAVLATDESRVLARVAARELGGTVKSQADYDMLVSFGQIDTGVNKTAAAAKQATATTVAASPAPAEAPKRRATDAPDVQNKVIALVQHANAVATEAAHVSAEAAALLDSGAVVGKPTILGLAQQINQAPRGRRTIGTKEKIIKRPPTDEGVLLAATEFFRGLAKPDAKRSKVEIVRELALWNGKKLQRKDVFAIIHAHAANLQIAPATISTQFQFARSGKAKQNA